MPDDFKYEWDAPENVARAANAPRATHVMDSFAPGPALSFDGALAADISLAGPANEITVFRPSAKSGWRLAHPNPRVEITHPTFLPGEMLAMVVTPPSYMGISEIWVCDIHGRNTRAIGQKPGVAFALPFASRDGSKILCFTEAPNTPQALQPTRRSYRRIGAFMLCEIDLGSRRSQILSPTAWRLPAFAGYDADQQGFYLNTGPSLSAVQSVDGRREYQRRTTTSRERAWSGYHLSRGQSAEFEPASAIPSQFSSTGGSAIVGVAASNALLLRRSRSNPRSPYGVSSELLLISANEVAASLSPDEAHIQKGTVSRNAEALLGWASARFEGGREQSLEGQKLYFFTQARARTQVYLESEIAVSQIKPIQIPSDTEFGS